MQSKRNPICVSILMPTYNAASFVARAIDSLQAQTLKEWELLAVDDCSADNTIDVLRAFAAKDKRIRVLKTPQNGGPSIARNLGLEHAKGAWITLLDADDAYLPDRLEYLVGLGTAHGLDMVADRLSYIDSAAGKTVRQWMPAFGQGVKWTFERMCRAHKPACDSFATLKPMFSATFIQRHAIRYLDDARHGEDFLFYADMLVHGAKAEITSTYAGYLYTQAIGELSGVSSGQSHTHPKAELFIQRLKDFGLRRQALLSSAWQQALQGCIDYRTNHLAAQQLARQLKQAKWGTALRTLRGRPGLLIPLKDTVLRVTKRALHSLLR